MDELQRYRALAQPAELVARSFVRAIEAAVVAPPADRRRVAAARFRIDAALLDRLAAQVDSPRALDEAELRWMRNVLPELVRQVARVDAGIDTGMLALDASPHSQSGTSIERIVPCLAST